MRLNIHNLYSAQLPTSILGRYILKMNYFATSTKYHKLGSQTEFKLWHNTVPKLDKKGID